MLELRKPRVYNENKVVTILGPGTKLVGELSCRGTIRVEGAVEGSVYSDDSVVLLDSGTIQGDVSAGQVIIGGQVRGDVRRWTGWKSRLMARFSAISRRRASASMRVLFEGLCTMKPGLAPRDEEPFPQPEVVPAAETN